MTDDYFVSPTSKQAYDFVRLLEEAEKVGVLIGERRAAYADIFSPRFQAEPYWRLHVVNHVLENCYGGILERFHLRPLRALLEYEEDVA